MMPEMAAFWPSAIAMGSDKRRSHADSNLMRPLGTSDVPWGFREFENYLAVQAVASRELSTVVVRQLGRGMGTGIDSQTI